MLLEFKYNSELEKFLEHKFVADKGQDFIRVDKYLMDRIENVTRVKIQDAIDERRILVNYLPTKKNYRIRPLDIITIYNFLPPRDMEVYPEDIPIDIVFEDDDIAIINKKAGMVVHPGHGNYNGTLVNALAFHFKQNPEKNQFRPWLVHRIDKDTSGLMVVAKTEMAMMKLAEKFKNHDIERKYIALVWGNVEQDQGTIIGNIARHESDRMQFKVYDNPEIGKHAITHYKVLERYHFATLVECQLETGRTHQIRVHMKHIGHTLFNDARYGGNMVLKGTVSQKYKQFIENAFAICPRQALHAKTLGFEHPSSSNKVFFESEIPEDFSNLIDKWKKFSSQF